LLVALALLAAACSSSDTDTTSATTSDQTAVSTGETDWPYQFSTKTVDGSLLDTGDYAGQDLVLWFWAPW